MAYKCECLKCGYTMETDQHCRDIKCPECGGEMRRAERPGPGKSYKPIALTNLFNKAFKETNDIGLAWMKVKQAGWYLKDGEWNKDGKANEAFQHILFHLRSLYIN